METGERSLFYADKCRITAVKLKNGNQHPKHKQHTTCTVVELPRSFELELPGVTLWGEASVFSADSDIDMLCIVLSAGAASDVPALSCDRHDTDHGRALLLLRFLRSCTWLVDVSYRLCWRSSSDECHNTIQMATLIMRAKETLSFAISVLVEDLIYLKSVFFLKSLRFCCDTIY